MLTALWSGRFGLKRTSLAQCVFIYGIGHLFHIRELRLAHQYGGLRLGLAQTPSAGVDLLTPLSVQHG